MSLRVTVVGAGPGGLAAAMLLAHSGCDVTVLERHDRVGGRTSTFTLSAGPSTNAGLKHPSGSDGSFHFDLGATFFLYPRVLEEVFAACGLDLHREVELTRLDPQYELIFQAGGSIRATPDVARMQAELAAIAPKDAERFTSFLDDNRAKLRAFRPILEQPFSSRRDLLRPNVLRSLNRLRPSLSVDGDLRRYFSDERVRLAFSFQSKYLGMSPFRCPSLFTILSFLEYEHGVYHPTGGCGAVTTAMARACEKMGVRILLNTPVESFDFVGQAITATRTGAGQRIACDSVVLNADFAAAMRRFIPSALRRRWTDRRIKRSRFSCSTFMLYLGIRGHYDHLAHHTIWLAKDYEQNLNDIERDHCLSASPSFYVQHPHRTDKSLAPDGHSTLYCLAPVCNQLSKIDWAAEKERFRQLMFRQMEHIGITNLRERIVVEKMITPADWESSQHIHLGATFNLAHNLGQMLHRRPHNRFEDLSNVYLVGGGTHPGSGLPVIFESSRISARLLLNDNRIPFVWPGQTGEHTKPSRTPPQTRHVLHAVVSPDADLQAV